jgi:hypothetical protein
MQLGTLLIRAWFVNISFSETHTDDEDSRTAKCLSALKEMKERLDVGVGVR